MLPEYSPRKIICKSQWLEKSSSRIFKGNGRSELSICFMISESVTPCDWYIRRNNQKAWGEGRGRFEKITVGEGWRTVRRIVNNTNSFQRLSMKFWVSRVELSSAVGVQPEIETNTPCREEQKRINFTNYIFDTDCFGLSGDKFTRRHCSRARSKTRRKGCQPLSRAFSTGTILEWQEWQSNISPWKHGYLWRED